jgi:hypothetical protein
MDCDEPRLALNEKTQPIQWTEWPTGALVAAGSLWPYINPFISILYADDFSVPEVAQGEADKEREREREKKLTLRSRFCIISRVAARPPSRRPP